MPWVCPDCGRSFGRARQPHACRPSVPLDEWLAGRDPRVRVVLDAVFAAVRGVGPVVVETTRDAVMVKRSRTFAEVKPRRDRVEVSFIVPRRIVDDRVVRTLDLTVTRVVHTVEARTAADVDRVVAGWLAEAYDASPT